MDGQFSLFFLLIAANGWMYACAAVRWLCGSGVGCIGEHPLLAAFILLFRGLRRVSVSFDFIFSWSLAAING